MKRPTFNENTEVKVVASPFGYGMRGTVTKFKVIVGKDNNAVKLDPAVDKDAIKLAYASNPDSNIVWFAYVSFANDMQSDGWFRADVLEPIQHKFVDIDYLREEDIVLGQKPDGTPHIRPKNTGAFEVGDIISITTKIDGANSSIAWDETTGKLEVFSRTNLLDSPGALRGFYDYIKTNVEPLVAGLDNCKKLVIYGEWCVSHTVQYDKEWYNKWRIYDIWDKERNCYLHQETVKDICKTIGLEYVEELYHGPFISWEHCRSFIGKSTAYGPNQEGIVIKNQSKLSCDDVHSPIYIKIVDEKFKEAQHSNKPPKVVDPEKAAAYEKAVELVEAVVTEARVKKAICKMIDEGQLPSELQPKDMGSVMKLLPKAVFDDIIKEEIETVNAVKDLGENIGKLVASTAAKHARAIVVGQK